MEKISVIYVLVGFLSLIVGSFLNVVIYRLPIMLKQNFLNEYNTFTNTEGNTAKQNFNLALPRSFCPKCKNKIPFWQNIPIISFLLLKGKCNSCDNKISWLYPSIESLSTILCMYAAIHFGIHFNLLFILLFIWIAIALFFIDLKHLLLPDILTLSLLWLGLLFNIEGGFQAPATAILSAVIAYVSLWCVANLYKIFTKKEGMGYGDLKLFAALGAWFGWEYLATILLISSSIGIIFALFYMFKYKELKNIPIPFGPFLILAGICVLFVNF